MFPRLKLGKCCANTDVMSSIRRILLYFLNFFDINLYKYGYVNKKAFCFD